MTVFPVQAVFNRGEFSPRLHAREDIEHYQAGVRSGLNWIVMRHGGLMRRPGTRHVAEVKDSSGTVRLVPFVFNEEQTYVLELGDLYFRVYADGGRIEVASVPVEVVTPYEDFQVGDLRFAQSNDTLYVAHGSHAPRKITRTSDTVWAISTITFEDGPFFIEDPDLTTTLTLSSTDDVLSGETVTASVGASPTNVNDGNHATFWNTGQTNGTLQVDLGAGDTDAATGYSIRAKNPAQAPVSWSFEGSQNASTWIVLDSRDGETGWVSGEIRHFAFNNETLFRHYRMVMTGTDGDTDDLTVAEWKIKRSGDLMTPITLTASSVTDINEGTGFQTTDVGRMLRLLMSDGQWRWARIAARSSTTVVTVRIYGPTIPDTTAISRWRMGAWSDESGWPSKVGFFEERLVWANTDTEPQRIWISEVSVFESHRVSDPNVASDAINLQILSGQANPIRWIAEGPDLLVGTAAAVRTIGQNDQSEGFGSDNVKQRRESTYGSSNIQPVLIGNIALYVDRGGTKLRELGYSFEVNGYVSPELTTLSDHLFRDGISGLAYAQDPESIVWVRLGSGRMIALTYDSAAKISGMTPVEIGTDPDDPNYDHGVVEAVAVVPGNEVADTLYMIVRRTIDGDDVQYVEYLTPFFEDMEIEDACFADSSLSYDGAPITAVGNLDHLEGATVGVLADGIDVGDFTVASGSITLTAEASKILVGLRYLSTGITLRPPSIGQRDGGHIGRRKRTGEVIIDMLDTKGLRVGSYNEYLRSLSAEAYVLQEITERAVDEEFDSAPDLQTGPFRAQLEDSWRSDGSIVFVSESMYPATVRAVMPGYEGEP